MMTLPAEIQSALVGLESSGENIKTASASDVFRYENSSSGAVVFLKIQRPSWSPPLSIEMKIMEWLCEKLPVPEVIAYHREDDVEYLVTTAVPGIPSHDRSCHVDKQRLVEQLAESLHTIHALPINDCPIDKTPTGLIAWGRQRIRAGIITSKMVEEENLTGSPDEALDWLEGRMPSLEGPVITHGDYCLPNVLIHNHKVSGFIDLGYFGFGDPYRDFIAAQYSVRRNLGEGWIAPFFKAFGVGPLNEEKLRWYRQIQAFD